MFIYLLRKTLLNIIYRYKLKKIEDVITKKPSIYHKGNYKDYDWEVFSYTYEI
jgi:hypothetical protein